MPPLEPEIARVILELMKRATLRGEEVPAYNIAVNAIEELSGAKQAQEAQAKPKRTRREVGQ